jgi:hypothetical protein
MKRTAGLILIYFAAFLIMLSILFLFKVVRMPYPYSTAAFGLLAYIVGLFLTREGGRFTPYKYAMIGVSVLLIVVALLREFVL